MAASISAPAGTKPACPQQHSLPQHHRCLPATAQRAAAPPLLPTAAACRPHFGSAHRARAMAGLSANCFLTQVAICTAGRLIPRWVKGLLVHDSQIRRLHSKLRLGARRYLHCGRGEGSGYCAMNARGGAQQACGTTFRRTTVRRLALLMPQLRMRQQYEDSNIGASPFTVRICGTTLRHTAAWHSTPPEPHCAKNRSLTLHSADLRHQRAHVLDGQPVRQALRQDATKGRVHWQIYDAVNVCARSWWAASPSGLPAQQGSSRDGSSDGGCTDMQALQQAAARGLPRWCEGSGSMVHRCGCNDQACLKPMLVC